MPQHIVDWTWEEAFCKFGFEDGDGPNFTDAVAEYIRSAGFSVETSGWGPHNYMITKVSNVGTSYFPQDVIVGYANPRVYLPQTLVAALDDEFPITRLNRKRERR